MCVCVFVLWRPKARFYLLRFVLAVAALLTVNTFQASCLLHAVFPILVFEVRSLPIKFPGLVHFLISFRFFVRLLYALLHGCQWHFWVYCCHYCVERFLFCNSVFTVLALVHVFLRRHSFIFIYFWELQCNKLDSPFGSVLHLYSIFHLYTKFICDHSLVVPNPNAFVY